MGGGGRWLRVWLKMNERLGAGRRKRRGREEGEEEQRIKCLVGVGRGVGRQGRGLGSGGFWGAAMGCSWKEPDRGSGGAVAGREVRETATTGPPLPATNTPIERPGTRASLLVQMSSRKQACSVPETMRESA